MAKRDLSDSVVLVVDDVPENLDILVELLGELYEVIVATDGASALEILNQQRIDIVLLDIMMPDIDGFEVCARVKADPNLTDIPVIFVSAMDETVDKLRGLELGGVDYITKPFQPEEVLARTKTHLTLYRLHKESEVARLLAERANEVKSRFIAAMSHELRTPLSAILGFDELLLSEGFGPLNEKQRRYADLIQNNAEQLIGLVNNVLDIAQADTGRMELFLEELSLDNAIQLPIDLVSSHAHKKGVTIHLDANIETFHADEKKIRQVMLNLLDNAIRFTEAETTINVEAKRDNGLVRISVQDHGPGIQEKKRESIFADFGTFEDPGDEYSMGTGLGLPLVRRLVQMHGGRIGLDTEVGEGTTIWFTLPQPEAGVVR